MLAELPRLGPSEGHLWEGRGCCLLWGPMGNSHPFRSHAGRVVPIALVLPSPCPDVWLSLTSPSMAGFPLYVFFLGFHFLSFCLVLENYQIKMPPPQAQDLTGTYGSICLYLPFCILFFRNKRVICPLWQRYFFFFPCLYSFIVSFFFSFLSLFSSLFPLKKKKIFRILGSVYKCRYLWSGISGFVHSKSSAGNTHDALSQTHIDYSALVLRNHTFILFGNIRGLWASVPTWSNSSSESGRMERSKSTPISLIRAVALLIHL